MSGQTFATYLRAHVFTPLGMNSSTTVERERDLPPSARGHLLVLGKAVALPEPPGFGNGSGGVLSTAGDMARWLIAQNNGILTPSSVRQMRTPSQANKEYALGWTLGETPHGTSFVEHGGDLFTSTADQLLMPGSGYGVAVMANTGMTYADAGALMDGLVALIEGDTPKIPSAPQYLLIDGLFLLLTLATIGPAVRGAIRSRRWAARRTGWQRLRLLPYLAPLALCLSVAPIFRVLARGGDIMWIQVVYLYPTFMIWLVTAAVACTAVVATRLGRVLLHSRYWRAEVRGRPS